jgi:polyisoprenoid-binding protein YceI
MKIFLISLFFLSTISFTTNKLYQNNDILQISFKIKNFGRTVDGKFTDIKVTSNFDENNLENSFIKAIIKVKSIDTKNTKRDKHLIGEDYFNQNQFPEIKLNSTSIIKLDQKNYLMSANLTIKDVSKNIDIPLEIISTENLIRIKSHFTINRRDYAVGSKSWVLSDLVKLEVNYVVNK